MSMIHDVVKIRLSKLGYLPNIPYHLISDDEMCDAFLSESENRPVYFYDYYPNVDSSIQTEYDNLVKAMYYHIGQLKESISDSAKLPDWIYSYMLGSAVGPMSDPLDIHDLILPLGVDNIDDEFNSQCAAACLQVSRRWLMKVKRVNVTLPDGTVIDTRPPTMFGEPHVVKYVRLNEVHAYRV